jgi:adenylate cyclase
VFLAHAGEIDGAREALTRLTDSMPYLSIETVEQSLEFMEPNLLARYIQGLRMAGLRES